MRLFLVVAQCRCLRCPYLPSLPALCMSVEEVTPEHRDPGVYDGAGTAVAAIVWLVTRSHRRQVLGRPLQRQPAPPTVGRARLLLVLLAARNPNMGLGRRRGAASGTLMEWRGRPSRPPAAAARRWSCVLLANEACRPGAVRLSTADIGPAAAAAAPSTVHPPLPLLTATEQGRHLRSAASSLLTPLPPWVRRGASRSYSRPVVFTRVTWGRVSVPSAFIMAQTTATQCCFQLGESSACFPHPSLL